MNIKQQNTEAKEYGTKKEVPPLSKEEQAFFHDIHYCCRGLILGTAKKVTSDYDEMAELLQDSYINLMRNVSRISSLGSCKMAAYTYDAWGNVLSATGSKADINPLRYRGYYYDTETGFYYLQSRYYDPANHRFINADGLASTGTGFVGHNMFAYCNNSPVLHFDTSGDTIEVIGSLFEVVIIKTALNYIKTSATGANLINTLEASNETFIIEYIPEVDSVYLYDSNTVCFNFNYGLLLDDYESVQSPAMCLAHELGHAAQDLEGLSIMASLDEYYLEDDNLARFETPMAKELGEPVRSHYRGNGAKIRTKGILSSEATAYARMIAKLAYYNYLRKQYITKEVS